MRASPATAAAAVAVTGIGVASPIGVGREAFWRDLCAGRSGIGPLEGVAPRTPLPTVAAQVRDFSPRDFISAQNRRRMDKMSSMVVAASRMALDDAGVAGRVAPERLGVVIGTTLSDIGDSAVHLDKVFTRGPAAASPMMFPNLVLNAPASYASMELGATGINLTVAQAEVSGEEAIIQACHAIRLGRADVVLAGGGDEVAGIVAETMFRARALAGQRGGPEWCSPYDAARNGIVIGEGTAVLVLESAVHARARGASVYAEIEADASFAVPAPVYDWPAAAPAAVEPLRRLVGSDPVELVLGSGNSSRRLDACEISVLGDVFGEYAEHVTLTSLKGAIGEFGGAGALTMAAACLALREQRVPPLCHLRQVEPGSRLRLAGRESRAADLQRVLVCGFARGGAVAAVLLRRP